MTITVIGDEQACGRLVMGTSDFAVYSQTGVTKSDNNVASQSLTGLGAAADRGY